MLMDKEASVRQPGVLMAQPVPVHCCHAGAGRPRPTKRGGLVTLELSVAVEPASNHTWRNWLHPAPTGGGPRLQASTAGMLPLTTLVICIVEVHSGLLLASTRYCGVKVTTLLCEGFAAFRVTEHKAGVVVQVVYVGVESHLTLPAAFNVG